MWGAQRPTPSASPLTFAGNVTLGGLVTVTNNNVNTDNGNNISPLAFLGNISDVSAGVGRAGLILNGFAGASPRLPSSGRRLRPT